MAGRISQTEIIARALANIWVRYTNKIDKDTLEKIAEAWRFTDLPSAPMAAENKMDKIIEKLTSGVTIEIDGRKISSELEFLDWKFSKPILNEIPIFNEISQLEKCEKITDFAKLIELHYVNIGKPKEGEIEFIGKKGKFRIKIGDIIDDQIESKKFIADTAKVDFKTYHTFEINISDQRGKKLNVTENLVDILFTTNRLSIN